MTSRLAFYVHHHGQGHVTRTRAILDELAQPATVLTSARHARRVFHDVEVVALARDDAEPLAGRQPPLPAHLHYAPSGVPGLRARMARIAGFLADTAPALLVVDVSSEVAQLARLVGIPTVVVRQHGQRWDAAHRAAYEGAVGLLAPFDPRLEEPDVPDWVRTRTFYAGGLARRRPDPPSVDGATSSPARRDGSRPRDERRRALGWDPTTRGVAVLQAGGGSVPDPAQVAAAAGATPDHRWLVVGDLDAGSTDVRSTGWVDDPLPWLDAADVVVGSGGHNTVMEAALVVRPFVCIPQERPFDEQRRKAARLRALGVAEVVDGWPDTSAWPAVLDRVHRRSTAGLATLVDPMAAGRATRWLTALARSYAP